MALINFRLKHPDLIVPWGDAPDTSMDWFGLTEGEYWLDLKKATLYEYTDEILRGDHDTRYVEFQIARLIEDWTGIFASIAEAVPDGFYSIANSCSYLYRFYGAVQQLQDRLTADAAEDVQAKYDRYDKAIDWIYNRTLLAPHLTCAPGLSFFRNGDKLALVWKADHRVESNIPVWTAKNGEIELPYEVFVREMEEFGERFFSAMDEQVQLAVEKDWGNTKINSARLVKEQQERRAAFQKKVAVLKEEVMNPTDWKLVNAVITEMFS
ncbi:DUF5984 family protein [Chitinophaga sancti]|uniref:DUF5984 family protein n=1 Tax=Chitinophaga sancti TaxID=1004 RepID=A0A1K1R7B8_9BACT|nr:DUF5984 family protein [Chitinophaga sancti]WQD64148.1 DUF5984 family protein [Chitinophaga sancti]WQG90228.1 DUF5984 family protein [Chitinophaga sancti]SFW67917.1 hypothetical protein SAMN05661012_03499 [Chitinophaga sancti]